MSHAKCHHWGTTGHRAVKPSKIRYTESNLAPAYTAGALVWGGMNDLERSLLEDLLDELAMAAPHEREESIRKMREKMLAIKLLERVPKSRTPWWWSGDFWRTALIVAGVIAALMGVKIPAIPSP